MRAMSSGVARVFDGPMTVAHTELNPALDATLTARPCAARVSSCAPISAGALPSALSSSVVTPCVSMFSAV